MEKQKHRLDGLAKAISLLKSLLMFIMGAILLLLLAYFQGEDISKAIKKKINSWRQERTTESIEVKEEFWSAPDMSSVRNESLKAQILYGKELIAHTAKYLGPEGIVMQISNGMNCQNCHLEAGTKIFGNNYSGVASTYPKFRARSGASEDIYKRVNDCIERSLNGTALDTLSKEMQAIKAYIVFLGTNVEKGVKPNGAGLRDLAYLDREADPEKGKLVYNTKCITCHMADGQGQKTPLGNEYLYPPLWGKSSYNDGAGLYRISNFAKYAKYNMPQGVSYILPTLTDEEAWDVAAFVNSQSRPHKEVPADWPDITKKPVDHPFGPFADTFTEKQHKYGPFKLIVEAQKNSSTAVTK